MLFKPAVTDAAAAAPCLPCSAKMVLELLKKEVELCKLQQDIREQVRDDTLCTIHTLEPGHSCQVHGCWQQPVLLRVCIYKCLTAL
jgi:hypothetical protein